MSLPIYKHSVPDEVILLGENLNTFPLYHLPNNSEVVGHLSCIEPSFYENKEDCWKTAELAAMWGRGAVS